MCAVFSFLKAMLDALETRCKCHGVSGSCSVKTCWKSLLDVGHISSQLKTRYLSATKVVPRQMGSRRQLVPREMEVRPVLENELVYLISSPDYCSYNSKHGSYGTTDRYIYMMRSPLQTATNITFSLMEDCSTSDYHTIHIVCVCVCCNVGIYTQAGRKKI